MSEKIEKMEHVAEEVLKILLARGIEGVTFAQVAKAAGVSRSWLYKYVGNTRESLVEFSVVHLGKIYSRLEVPRTSAHRAEFIEHAIHGLEYMLDATLQYPWVLQIYYRYKGTENPVGEVVDSLERRYLARKEQQVALCLKPTIASARIVAENLTWLNLGICMNWLRAARRTPQARGEIVSVVRTFLESVR